MDLSSIPSESLLSTMKAATARAATALADILGCDVEIELDHIRLLPESEFKHFLYTEVSESGTAVHITFSGGLSGRGYFLLPAQNEQAIMQILSEHDPELIDEAGGQTAILVEMANIVFNMYVGTIINQMGVNVVYGPPKMLFKDEKLEWLSDYENNQSHQHHYQIMTSRMSISGQKVLMYVLLTFSG